jgi:hypothetical protein
MGLFGFHNKMNNIFPSSKAMRLGKELQTKLFEINSLLSRFDRNSGITQLEIPKVLDKLEGELDQLYTLICDLKNADPLFAISTYEKKHSHPRFKVETPLEVILSYTYLMALAIQEQAKYTLITDAMHLDYAKTMLSVHNQKFSSYVRV